MALAAGIRVTPGTCSTSISRHLSSVGMYVNIFKHLSETTGPIEAIFHVEPSWNGGSSLFKGPVTNMAAMPIKGKNQKNKKKIFS